MPTGAASGDIAVVGIYMESAATVTPPAGFQTPAKADLQTSVASRGRLVVFWKRLTAADTGTYAFSFTSTFCAAACGLWSGRSTTGDPFDGTVGTAESTTSVATLNASTSPTAASGDAVGFWTNFSGGNAFTAPTNYTERADLDVITMDTRDAVASGSTGSISASSNVSGFQKAFLGVLALASGGSNFTQNPTDNLGLTDTAALSLSKVVTDPVGLTEVSLVGPPWVLAPADSESLTDNTVVSVGKNQAVTDAVGLTDSVTVAGPAKLITSIAGSGNQQYPVDQSGNPILVKGDVIWAFPANAGRWNGGDWQGDITSYLNVRQGQGFNLLMIGALGSTQNGGPSDTGATWDSVSPWASGVKGNLNTTYWDRVDYIVDQAAARGITVLMNVAYSYDMDTAALNGATNTQYTNYGTNLGNRYKTKTNLIWGVGGDYFDTQQVQIGNLFTAITAAGDTHLRSVQNYPESTSRKDISNNATQNTGVSWSSWNFVYSYNVTYDGVEYAYDETTPIMAIWGDGHFDQNSSGDRVVLRNDIWWAFSSGARGHIYGSEGTWNWQISSLSNASTETVPSTDLAGYWSILTGLVGWWKLVPDTDSSFVTAGRGTHAAALTSGGGGGGYDSADPQDQYVTASVAPDGSLAVVYTPVAHTITVNPAEMSGTYTVRKVDPANGSSSSVTIASTYAISGTNSRGGTDWLLVFESVGGSNWTQTPTDAEGVTDAAALAQAKTAPESVGVTDSVVFTIGSTATDAEGLTDTVAIDAGKAQTLADVVGLTDSIALTAGKALSDAEGLTDFSVTDRGTAAADTEALSDTAAFDRGVATADAEGLTDTAAVVNGRAVLPGDTEALTDSAALVLNYQQTPADTVGLTDSAQTSLSGAGSVSPTDNVGVTDATAVDQAHGVADAEGLTDSSTLVLGYQQLPLDAVGLTDAAGVQLTSAGSITPTDPVGVADTTVLARASVVADTAGISDSVAVILTKTFGDVVGLSDLTDLARGFTRVLTDAANVTDAAAVVVTAGAPFTPLLDPVSAIRPNLATATSRGNAATATIRANPVEAAT